MKITFGKYKGQDTADIPLGYIKWLEAQEGISDELREECQWLIQRAEGDRPGIGKERKPTEGPLIRSHKQ